MGTKMVVIGSAMLAGLIGHYGLWDHQGWFLSVKMNWQGDIINVISGLLIGLGFQLKT